jgi:FAD/FMN-containing dehydrogenase
VNFMGKARSAAHFASAWPPATFARLAEVRKRYDPEEVLSSGH